MASVSLYDRLFSPPGKLYRPAEKYKPLFSLVKRVIEFVGEQFPQACIRRLPSLLAPTQPLPFDNLENESTLNSYLVTPDEQKQMSEVFSRNQWHGNGVKVFGELNQYIFKGLPYETGIRLTRTFTGCNFFPLRWEATQALPSDRVAMAKRMRTAIEQEKLDRLYVPKKRICFLQGPQSEKIAVCERLYLKNQLEAENHFEKLSKSDKHTLLSQLFTLCIKTGCSDLRFGDNLSFVYSGEAQGKLAIFDTEPFGIERVLQKKPMTPSRKNPSSTEYHEENRTARNIYLIGGERNAEIAMGMKEARLFFTKEEFLEFRAWCKPFLLGWIKGTCEYTANLIKIWALRLFLPGAALASMAFCLRRPFSFS